MILPYKEIGVQVKYCRSQRFHRDPNVLSRNISPKIQQRLPKLQMQVKNLIKLSFHSPLFILVQYSNKFMQSIVKFPIVLLHSLLLCFCTVLLCEVNTIQCHA